MSRLPTVGSDDDAWGDILNDFLAVAHNADGSIKDSVLPEGIPQFKAGAGGTETFTASGDGSVAGGWVSADPGHTGLITTTSDDGGLAFGWVDASSVNTTLEAGRGGLAAGQVRDGSITADNGSFAFGYNNGGSIEAFGGGFAAGYIQGGGTIQNGYEGGFAFGYVRDGGTVESQHYGAVAFGKAEGTDSRISASDNGALASGHAKDGGTVFSNGYGSLAGGSAVGATARIDSSGGGSIAFGYAYDSGQIIAAGAGSFAIGYAGPGETIQAPQNGVQIGAGSNGISKSLKVGEGIHIMDYDASGLGADIRDGMIWKDGGGNVMIRSSGTTLSTIQEVNDQSGTTYTLLLTDNSNLVTLTNGSAITLTVPTNASVAFPVGAHIDLFQAGAGQVTVAAAGGVTVNTSQTLKLRGQYSAATLVKRATNTWFLVGDLEAA